ncbi:MAG: hypothetical protein KAY24_15690 [Candidatus Eisenbacteria sp.]|nr:hypothetical protein [Candidatus Eisenbacteria bacterium]
MSFVVGTIRSAARHRCSPAPTGRAGATRVLLLALLIALAGTGDPRVSIVADAAAQNDLDPSPEQPEVPQDEPPWITNTELRASRIAAAEATTPTPPIADEDRFAEVFDSADFQFLLLLGAAWEEAYILDLATGDVWIHSKAALWTPAEELTQPSSEDGDYGTTFVPHEDGRISFVLDPWEITVEPLPPMLGLISEQELLARQPVYRRRAEAYDPDPEMITCLAGIGETVDVVAFFGSWCQICKHSLPELLRIHDLINNPSFSLTLVALDEDVVEPEDWISNCGISRVPSFIVRIDEEEIGRIEEEPEISMEVDLVRILFGNGVQ